MSILAVNFPLCLAPMVGLSHVALRAVARSYLPPKAATLWPTEMLSSWRLPNENLQQTPETLRAENENYLIPQILGNEEKPIRESIQRLQDWGADGIDMNMGCPVQKALRHNYGVALMGDPGYAAKVVDMAVRSARVPVSVKLRGVATESEATEETQKFLQNFVYGLREAGASWICLHPRTAAQKRRGRADWQQIRELKKAIALPVIGNGDIQTVEDVHQMLSETQCDMVMSGRALAARPWMLWQLGEDLGWGSPYPGKSAPRSPEEEGAEYGRVFQALIEQCGQHFREDQALRKLRFWVRTTSCWLFYGHDLLKLSTQVTSLKDMQTRAADFFSQPMPMLARTDLRQ